jgi:hypothetical protein
MPTGAFFVQQPVMSFRLEKNVVREQKYGKTIYYVYLVRNLLSSNFLVTSDDGSTR